MVKIWGYNHSDAAKKIVEFLREKKSNRKTRDVGLTQTLGGDSQKTKSRCSLDRYTQSPQTKEQFELQIRDYLPEDVSLKPLVFAEKTVDCFEIWQLSLHVEISSFKGWKWVCRSLGIGETFYNACILRNTYILLMLKFRRSFSASDSHKKQSPNNIDGWTREEYVQFERELVQYNGEKEVIYPLVDGSFLDPLILFSQASSFGGYQQVELRRKWKSITQNMGYVDLSNAKRLKKFVEDYFVDFAPTNVSTRMATQT
eukprot:TRINITY_DN932_c0_g1_i1.p1 TRINITY_DN932_c0_g1~~TRINITY_DN932_c0_g1_i1.p1  ORF type:complete len:257 (-),score=114.09 TRINITY_DN932_c0_g1_i1:56-826(-)